MRTGMMLKVSALLISLAAMAQGQDVTAQQRIRIQKDAGTVGSASGLIGPGYTEPMDSIVWYRPLANTCGSVDVNAARAVSIKTDLYNASTMISPDSAKVIALCAVPGQIGSGEMNVANGITEYAIDIIPNHKRTHTKVIVDAQTGAVLSSKQFGGVRGLTGWVRESAEHKKNVNESPKDSVPPQF